MVDFGKHFHPPHHKPSDDNFEEMVMEAIADELGAVAMYSNMANMVEDPTLRALIYSIAGDEYGHARTWMVILNLIKCVKICD